MSAEESLSKKPTVSIWSDLSAPDVGMLPPASPDVAISSIYNSQINGALYARRWRYGECRMYRTLTSRWIGYIVGLIAFSTLVVSSSRQLYEHDAHTTGDVLSHNTQLWLYHTVPLEHYKPTRLHSHSCVCVIQGRWYIIHIIGASSCGWHAHTHWTINATCRL